ncbi:MAG: hypothetical protein F4Z22_06865 [Acidimicrobiia bacterium]|nr:hypothetical protein [Acidimicrobiia bacterium]
MDVIDWPPLVGAGPGLRQLEAALAAPVHAYLLVGTVAGDKRALARAFAGELLVSAAAASVSPQDPERHRDRARRAVHPDVVVVEPEGRALLASEAATIITEAARRPVEGAGKVIICDRFHTAAPDVAASLLKTIEEPPPGTTIVLLADEVPPGHITVASRCVTVRFPTPAPEEMCDWLVESGVPPEVADRAARALGCDPGRAGELVAAGDLAERLDAWLSIPARLDGTGARAAELVDRLRGLIDSVEAASSAASVAAGDSKGSTAAEPARADSGGRGGSAASAKADRQRSDRRRRRARDAELRFGLAVLAERYRELLDGSAGDRRGSTGELPATAVATVAEALDLLRSASEALVRNPDEKLLLQNLLLHLPRLEPA